MDTFEVRLTDYDIHRMSLGVATVVNVKLVRR